MRMITSKRRKVSPSRQTNRRSPLTPKDISAPVDSSTPSSPPYQVPSTSFHFDLAELTMRDYSREPLLSREEEIELAKRIKCGDPDAKEQFILANTRLAIKIAREYEGNGLELTDLISAGVAGIEKAVSRFDPAKANGGRFSTYGSWWIKQSIKKAISDQGKTIRLPLHQIDKIAKYKKLALKFHQRFGREPTLHELARETGKSPAELQALLNLSARPISLSQPVGDELDGRTVGDAIADDHAETGYDAVDRNEIYTLINQLVDNLEGRERAIIVRRFGLDGKKHETLEAIGKRFHVTRERIRQIEAKALLKIREKFKRAQRTLDPALEEMLRTRH